MTKSADSALRAVAAAVAMREGRDQHIVRREMLDRIAVVIRRSTAYRVRRRSQRRGRDQTPWAAAASQFHTLQVDDQIRIDVATPKVGGT